MPKGWAERWAAVIPLPAAVNSSQSLWLKIFCPFIPFDLARNCSTHPAFELHIESNVSKEQTLVPIISSIGSDNALVS
jgi:hypothetical protein